jgi:hypothetical protein
MSTAGEPGEACVTETLAVAGGVSSSSSLQDVKKPNAKTGNNNLLNCFTFFILNCFTFICLFNKSSKNLNTKHRFKTIRKF